MAQSWRSWDWKLGLASSLAMGGAIAASGDSTLAQNITLDGSLGPAQTLTGPNYSIPQAVGQTVDSNLFHSFGQFGLNTGESAIFESAANIRNILSRVTGGSSSFIDGLIDTQSSSVNLFLINPQGIQFGRNARLDVGGVDRGSFVATTFDALVWPNGGQFSATNPGGPSSLLTLVGDPSGFLSSLRPPQSIASSLSNLQVSRGQSLLLLGGNVSLDGGNLQAPGGRVELGGVAGAGTVGLSIDSQILSLSFPDGVARADVSLTNGAGVNVRAGGGGSIAVNARNLNILAGSQLRAGIEPNLGSVDSNAGNVEINATEAITINGVRNGTPTDTGVFYRVGERAVGKGGDINITTGSLSGSNRAQLRNSTFGQGDAGSVKITARDTVSFDGVGSNGTSTGVFARVEEGAFGKGGDINITTGSLAVINDARLSSSTFGRGDGGNVIVQARDTVSIAGDPNRPRLNPNGSRNFDGGGVFSQLGFPGQTSIAVGKGGDINITTGSLSVTNGNFLSTATRGQGNAGNVRIVARDTVFLDGVGGNGLSTGAFSNVEPQGVGSGGSVDITAQSISVTNGATLSTTTSGRGNAGDVRIVATDTVSFDGVGSNRSESAALSTVAAQAVGSGGSIDIRTGSLSVTNGARLSASSATGNGAAGNIEVSASSIRLDNQAALRADTRGGQGNITVDSEDLVLRRGSNITTNATGTAGGGNITIDTGGIAALENSDITANAIQGQGGNIQINTQQIFRSPDSDITASSELGIEGTVEINRLDVDPTQGLVNLPTELVDVSNQIAQGCPAGVREGKSQFIITGRGGLPPNPNEPLTGEALLTDWATLDPEVENRSSTTPSTNSTKESAPNQIVEAQGWVINNKGEVVLTATAPTATLQIPWVPDSNCHTPEPQS